MPSSIYAPKKDWIYVGMDSGSTWHYISPIDTSRATGSEGMTPVEYRIVGEPSPYGFGSVRIVGDVIIDGKKVGDWTTTIKKKYLDAVSKNLTEREQPMAKTLFAVYIVDGEELVYTWTGVASSAEIARLKVLQEFDTETDVEDLDIFTHALGCLRKD